MRPLKGPLFDAWMAQDDAEIMLSFGQIASRPRHNKSDRVSRRERVTAPDFAPTACIWCQLRLTAGVVRNSG